MSFQINKNSSGRISKKQVVQGLTASSIFSNTPFLSSSNAILVNNRNFEPVITNITSTVQGSEENSTVSSTGTLSQAILNKSEGVTLGQASPGKILSLDSLKNVTGVNILKCSSIIANGVNIATDIGDPSSIVVANDYFSDNVAGVATAGKCLVADGNRNVSLKKINGNVEDIMSISESKFKNMNIELNTAASLSSKQWLDVIYSVDLQKFLAIGNEVVATSSNGNSWTEYVKTGIEFKKVKWISHVGKYFAVASDGVYESSDGTDWTKIIVSVGIVDISVGTVKMVAFNSTTIFSKNLNASTWTETSMTSGMSAIAWKSISYGSGKVCTSRFIAVGVNNVAYCLEGGVDTNTNWITSSLTGSWIDVTFGNDVFIAVNSLNQANNKFTTSSNGVHWFAGNLSFRSIETGIEQCGFRSVKYLQFLKLFFLIPVNSTNSLIYTQSGNELYYMKYNAMNVVMGLDYSPISKKVVAVASGVDKSIDTQLVSTMTPTLTNNKYFKNNAGDWGHFHSLTSFDSPTNSNIVFAHGGNGIAYSTDGFNFSKCILNTPNGNLFDNFSRNIKCLTYSPVLNKYFACSDFSVANGFSNGMVSVDGITWIDINIASGNENVEWMAWSNSHGKLYAVGSNRLYSSVDGVSWTFQSYISGYSISVVDINGVETVILHGNHSAKRYHILNQDLTYTPLTFDSYGLRPFIKFNGIYYSAMGNSIYKSIDNCNNWVVDTDLGASIVGITYNKKFNCVVAYTNNAKVATLFTTGSWNANTMWFSVSLPYANNICYSSYYECIYLPSSRYSAGIAKTVSTNSSVLMSSNVFGDFKIWSTLPDRFAHNRDIDDSIITAFRKNTSVRSFTITASAAEPLRYLLYSRHTQKWYIPRLYVSSGSQNTIETTNEFLSITTPNKYIEMIDMDYGLQVLNGGTYSSSYSFTSSTRQIQIFDKYKNTYTTHSFAASSASQLYSPRIKYCKETKNSYYMANNNLYLVHIQKSPSDITIHQETIAITSGPAGAIDSVICKERNLLVYVSNVSNVRRVTTCFLPNAPNILYNITMPNKTFVRVEYHYEAKCFIVLATDAIYYSYDGAVWTETPTSFAGYTFNYYSMQYIPELNVMGLTAAGMFAFSRDGINWTILQTTENKAWFSFDYDPNQAKIGLLSADGFVFLSAPIQATVNNTVVPASSFISNDKFHVYSQNKFYPESSSSYSLNVDNGVFARCGDFQFSFHRNWNSGEDLEFFTNGNLRVIQTDPSANSNQYLKINGNYLTMNPKILSNAKLVTASVYNEQNRNEIILKNSLSLIKSGGSLSATSLSTENINVSGSALNSSEYGDMGLIVADPSKNVTINKLGINCVDIDGFQLKNSSKQIFTQAPPTQAPFFPLGRYMNFRNTKFLNGKQTSNILGSAYSPELNVLVIYANANSAQVNQCLYISNDKGKSWFHMGINNGYGFNIDSNYHSCKIKWIPSLSVFCLAQNSNIMVSSDGYNWVDKYVPYGNGPSLFWDSKLNRLGVVSDSRIAYPTTSNLLGEWVTPVDSKNLICVEYYSPLDVYFFRDRSNTLLIKSTTNIYGPTITSTNTTDNGTVSDMIVWEGMLYYLSANSILRRNVAGTTAGTAVYNNTSVTFKRIISLTVMDNVKLLVAFSNLTFAYSLNGTSWVHNTYANAYMPTYNNSTEEGIMNNMFWVGDRLMMIVNSDGALLESIVDDKMYKSSVSYLDSLVTRRISHNRLMSLTKQSDLVVRHSNTPMNIYATAYGGGYFVSTGDNVNIISDSLKKNQSSVTHSGLWRDIVYHKLTNQFIKIGNEIMSTALVGDINTWTDITAPSGNWSSIISLDDKVYLFESGTTPKCKVAVVNADIGNDLNSGTNWVDISLSTASSSWNGFEIINDKLFLLGNNYIAYRNISDSAWTEINVDGIWNDISFGRNLYVVAGNGFIARSRNLSIWNKTFYPKDYHRVIYVRLLGEFYLMNKDTNYFSNDYLREQTNAVIKTIDGINFTGSLNAYLHVATVTARRPYNLSNIYYFEEVDQFALPLNNSGNKYYMFTAPYAPKKQNFKITNPQTFTSAAGKIEIARGSSAIAAPLIFNVFQDSAAKPGTSTWTTTSDRRLKEDIQPANLETCWNNMENLELKYFKWKDQYIDENITRDRKKLGWIAQEVETVIPKAVKKCDMFGIDDCRVLDSDQIIANMFGTAKLLLRKLKEKEEAVFNSQ